jgi:hypothetical protein
MAKTTGKGWMPYGKTTLVWLCIMFWLWERSNQQDVAKYSNIGKPKNNPQWLTRNIKAIIPLPRSREYWWKRKQNGTPKKVWRGACFLNAFVPDIWLSPSSKWEISDGSSSIAVIHIHIHIFKIYTSTSECNMGCEPFTFCEPRAEQPTQPWHRRRQVGRKGGHWSHQGAAGAQSYPYYMVYMVL